MSELKLALVAHDACKPKLVEWASNHRDFLLETRIIATGTTGERLKEAIPSLDITACKSGPLGGDQQIGAMICEGRLDGLIFFIDSLSPMPHDVDVKALTRLAIVYNLPFACNEATADCIIHEFQRNA